MIFCIKNSGKFGISEDFVSEFVYFIRLVKISF